MAIWQSDARKRVGEGEVSEIAASGRRLTGLAYAAMLVQGVNAGWLGPFLPAIANSLHVTIDRVGLVISAVAAGYLIALLTGGEIAHRTSAQRVLAGAMALVGAGLLGVAVAPALPLMLCAALVLGLGQGAIDIAGNALVANLNSFRLGAALNYLHMMFGIGALLGPIIAGFALGHGISYSITFGAGAAGALLIGWVIRAAPPHEARIPHQQSVGAFVILIHPLIWIIALVLFLYVGAESGIGAWLFSYLRATSSLSASIASWSVSLFWLGLILGRVLGARLAHRSPPRAMSILAAVLCASALAFLIMAPGKLGFDSVMIMIAGLGFGPIFPNMIAIGADKFPADVGRVTSVVGVGGAVGAVIMPWLMGLALATSGARVSMGLALAATLLMLFFLLILSMNPFSRIEHRLHQGA